jgi:PTS system ascorbate-specific IIA component
MIENQKSPRSFFLKKILTIETVRANVRVDTWQQAADKVGCLLVEAGKVETKYIRRMKQALDEVGPYVVVAPGIALLHARPEDGVLQPCISLITLENPVEFGHSENDPVDIVIAFGAIDKDSHIPALKQLAEKIGNEQIIKQIRSATSDEFLLEAFIASNQDLSKSKEN